MKDERTEAQKKRAARICKSYMTIADCTDEFLADKKYARVVLGGKKHKIGAWYLGCEGPWRVFVHPLHEWHFDKTQRTKVRWLYPLTGNKRPEWWPTYR